MKTIIQQGINSLLATFQNTETAAQIGITPENVIETWNPEFTISELTQGLVFLVIFLQDCSVDQEELRAGITKTLSFRVAILKKIPEISNSEIQPAVECFERLQNFLTGFRSWTSSESVNESESEPENGFEPEAENESEPESENESELEPESENETQLFTVTKVTTAGIVDPDTLTQYLTVECGLDLEVETFVPYD